MTRVIAVMNQKGGVGKTTTTLNLGAALAQGGRRVLLVDLDPQANLSLGLNVRAPDLSRSIHELLTNPACDMGPVLQRTAYERLDLIPSHIDLSGAELEMVTMLGRETRLKRALDPLQSAYDYILIDCLPSLSLLTVNAMVAAGEVLVPLQAHPFALEGLGKLFEIVGLLRDALNPALRVSGVLVTLYDSRTNVSRETMGDLRGDVRLAPHLFTTLVRNNIKIAESQKDGIPVIHFDPKSPGAQAYVALGEEVLEMEASGCLASAARQRIEARAAVAGATPIPVPEPEPAALDERPLPEQVPAADATKGAAEKIPKAEVSAALAAVSAAVSEEYVIGLKNRTVAAVVPPGEPAERSSSFADAPAPNTAQAGAGFHEPLATAGANTVVEVARADSGTHAQALPLRQRLRDFDDPSFRPRLGLLAFDPDSHSSPSGNSLPAVAPDAVPAELRQAAGVHDKRPAHPVNSEAPDAQARAAS